MAEFHSENCKDIFDICTRFNMKLYTKDEAKAAIEKCDLSNKLNFRPSVQNTLSNLLKVDEDILEETLVINTDTEIKEITEEEVVVEVTSRKAKRRTHEGVIKKENE
jgi:Holliday junction resolvase RusA-like endonuclease